MMYSSAVRCDKCGATRLALCVHKTLLKQVLRKEGWSFGKQDLCPNCKKNKSVTDTNVGCK